jgi:hypothetical protein
MKLESTDQAAGPHPSGNPPMKRLESLSELAFDYLLGVGDGAPRYRH